MKIEYPISQEKTNFTLGNTSGNSYFNRIEREEESYNEEDEFISFKTDLIENPEEFLIDMNILDESDLAQNDDNNTKSEKKRRKIVRLKRKRKDQVKEEESFFNKDKGSVLSKLDRKDGSTGNPQNNQCVWGKYVKKDFP